MATGSRWTVDSGWAAVKMARRRDLDGWQTRAGPPTRASGRQNRTMVQRLSGANLILHDQKREHFIQTKKKYG